MVKVTFITFVSVLLLSTSAPAQPVTQQPERPRGQIPDLGRPTEKADEVPTFDYNQYFPGTWQFEWRVPESPLGPGGTLRGTETFTVQDGNFSTSHTEAEGPTGPFTIESVIAYQAKQRTFARWDQDSRGFQLFHAGPIGGDLGGFYTIHYETGPLTYAGQKVRLRYRTRLVSPVNYKVEARISIDDGPFLNFGSAWFQKAIPATTNR
jgi:hypothetical protein